MRQLALCKPFQLANKLPGTMFRNLEARLVILIFCRKNDKGEVVKVTQRVSVRQVQKKIYKVYCSCTLPMKSACCEMDHWNLSGLSELLFQ